jgi:ATP-dependent Clp protease ATP-binding subunit ClpC
MPKINVYLPDDLAAAVRAAGFPVSPVCQQALAEAVRTVGIARKAIDAIRDPAFDPDTLPQIGNRIAGRMTLRLREAIRLAREQAVPTTYVDTTDLLIGVLDEGDNLAVRLLQALAVDADELRAAAQQIETDEPSVAEGPDVEDSMWRGLTVPARAAIASALEASIDLGHNYLGCEHLLLGLLEEGDCTAARVLRSFGVEPANARRAVTAALAGFVHARQTSDAPTASKIDAIIRRLDALESRLVAAGV